MDPLTTAVRELTNVAVNALCGSWPTAQSSNVKHDISSSKVISDVTICFKQVA